MMTPQYYLAKEGKHSIILTPVYYNRKRDIIHCRDCRKACWDHPDGVCGGHYAGVITPDFFCGEAVPMDGV